MPEVSAIIADVCARVLEVWARTLQRKLETR